MTTVSDTEVRMCVCVRARVCARVCACVRVSVFAKFQWPYHIGMIQALYGDSI